MAHLIFDCHTLGTFYTSDQYAAVLLATHNRASVAAAAALADRLGLRTAHPRVHYAQSLGLADDGTGAL